MCSLDVFYQANSIRYVFYQASSIGYVLSGELYQMSSIRRTLSDEFCQIRRALSDELCQVSYVRCVH